MIGSAAACSNERRSGLRTSFEGVPAAYSANEPSTIPITSSPGLNSVTLTPTCSPTPAPAPPTGPDPRQLDAALPAAPGHVRAPGPLPHPAEFGHGPRDVGLSRHDVPHVRPGPGRPNLDQHLVVTDHGIGNLPELQHVGLSELVLHDRLHGQSFWAKPIQSVVRGFC